MWGEPSLLYIEEPVEVVRTFSQDTSLTFPWGGVSGIPIWEETSGQTKETLERLYLSAGLGTLGVPQEELVDVAREKSVWMSLLKLLHPRPGPG